jgi:hypothetical protein
MQTLVKADMKGRVPIQGTRSGQQYLVIPQGEGWFVTPAPEPRPPKRHRNWPAPKQDLTEHLQALADAGLTGLDADRSEAGPCRF